MQNLRRSHYKLTAHVNPRHQLPMIFTEPAQVTVHKHLEHIYHKLNLTIEPA
jgi:hypothetical protein